MPFEYRTETGRQLATKLESYEPQKPIVLGIFGEGMPIAAEVARHLGARLDFILVREIRAPGIAGAAVGAVAEGGAVHIGAEAARGGGLTIGDISALLEESVRELAVQVRRQRSEQPFPDVSSRTVIVVAEAVTRAAVVLAAALAVRELGAEKVIFAAPSICEDAAARLREEFDEVVAIEFPVDTSGSSRLSVAAENLSRAKPPDVVECRRASASIPSERGDPAASRIDDSDPPALAEEQVVIPFDDAHYGPRQLEGVLAVPRDARALVVFVHGRASTRHSPRDRFVARILRRSGYATLLFDLLTPEEEAFHEVPRRTRFDVDAIAPRIVGATRWLDGLPHTRHLRLALFGVNTGAAAALLATAALRGRVGAVVTRGGRPDLVAPATLESIWTPVLLMIGHRDSEFLEPHREAIQHLKNARLEIVPGATHLFQEPGALRVVARLTNDWFEQHLCRPDPGLGARRNDPGVGLSTS